MPFDELHKEIFGSLLSVEELSEIGKKYPYFGPVHFFKLTSMNADDAGYAAAAGMTSLHFNNPYLANLQLNKKDNRNNFLSKEGAAFPQQSSKVPAEKNTTPEHTDNQSPKDELLFEPLHTSDYFASQGIKLSQEQSDDKLGKQLKSFTEWLKTMKKPNGYRLQENKVVDKTVEKLAEKSNIETEVTTETMAEVFVKQGKLDKAFEIYTKLSLQNPAKSAYFASKIEQLKEK